jgi:DNA-binding PadR family transcriptional regulator
LHEHRDRARRGEARYVLLDALRDGPKHGYEIIKALEERSAGQYAPSPGTVYPTLQYLEDLGLMRSDQEADRRVYHLTEAGRAELDAHAKEVEAFWARLKGPGTSATSQAEIGFLQDELENLTRTVWGGLRAALNQDDPETIRRVRQAVEQCRNEVRQIIADSSSEVA